MKEPEPTKPTDPTSGWPVMPPRRVRPRPDTIEAPWGGVFQRYSDGQYREHAADPPRSYGALEDLFDRWRSRRHPRWQWRLTTGGILFRVVGDRFAVVRRDTDGTYRAGHCAIHATDGVWLGRRLRFDAARALANQWSVTQSAALGLTDRLDASSTVGSGRDDSSSGVSISVASARLDPAELPRGTRATGSDQFPTPLRPIGARPATRPAALADPFARST